MFDDTITLSVDIKSIWRKKNSRAKSTAAISDVYTPPDSSKIVRKVLLFIQSLHARWSIMTTIRVFGITSRIGIIL